MDKALEHDPCHVRTREHYEAMVRQLRQEAAVAARSAGQKQQPTKVVS